MKEHQIGLWFIEKGSVGIYTKNTRMAVDSMNKGYKATRVKQRNHIFHYH